MATLCFEKLSGSKFTYVPFTDAAPQTAAFLGGHVAAMVGDSDDLARYKDKIWVLVFASDERFPDCADSPTFKDQGLGMVEAIDCSVAVPPGTPEPGIQGLEAALLAIARNPEIVAEMEKQGFVPLALGQKESMAYIETMTVVYKELAVAADVQNSLSRCNPGEGQRIPTPE